MYHYLWSMSCKICKCLFCNNFSRGLLMHRGLLAFQWRHLALRNAAKLISEKCKNIFARVRIVCDISVFSCHALWFRRPNCFLPFDGHLRYQTIGGFLYTWKLLTALGGCASPAAEVGHSRPAEDWTEPGDMESSEVLRHLDEARPMVWEFRIHKKQHQVSFNMLWISIFYMNCRIFMLHELRL